MSDPGKVQIRVNLTLLKKSGSPRIQYQNFLVNILVSFWYIFCRFQIVRGGKDLDWSMGCCFDLFLTLILSFTIFVFGTQSVSWRLLNGAFLLINEETWVYPYTYLYFKIACTFSNWWICRLKCIKEPLALAKENIPLYRQIQHWCRSWRTVTKACCGFFANYSLQ